MLKIIYSVSQKMQAKSNITSSFLIMFVTGGNSLDLFIVEQEKVFDCSFPEFVHHKASFKP